jgi:Ca2+-binding EF-hand superfamily protein
MNLPHVSSDEIALFFKRWDKDVDGRLKFSEFTEAFTPFDN